MSTSPGNKSGSGSSIGSETYLGRQVVDAGLATPQEVKACRDKQKQLTESGKPVKLADLLVKAGVVTGSQLRRLASQGEDSVTGSLTQLPGFQVLKKVGAGAMASVYKAKQLSLDRIVAIKILPKRLSEDPEFVQRFYKEGRAAAKLNHNNIVQAIDVGEYAGYHYFVMEFVDGETVYDQLIRHRVYKEPEALAIILQIARALEHAHARGFIHRDVKPKNIMITQDGVAKLADMGLAREAKDAEAAAKEKGRAYGTPYYISPEQVRGVEDVDFRADIYSLGATLYHMVTGKVPFEGSTPASIMHKHLKEPLIPPDHINAKLSTGLAEVVERMMAKDRDQRYLSTTDLIVDLERVQRGEPPLQARTGYDDQLLENLSSEGEGGESFRSPGLPPGHQAAHNDSANYTVPLAALAVVELLVILILIIVLAA